MKKMSLILGVALSLVLAGCGGGTDDAPAEEGNGSSTGAGSVGESLDYTITGIDAGAGIMAATKRAIEEYNLEGYELQTSSDAAMTAALGEAIANEEPIVVTGWNPHWKFAKYDLKYLDDPKGVYGGEETINTFGRKGLEEDHPEAFQVLSNFKWTEDDMGAIMLSILEGEEPEVAARQWVENNADKVAEWTNGVGTVDGGKITLALVAWDSTIASSNTMKVVLEDLGYEVDLAPMEGNFMWSAVANGEADAFLAGWLPVTHAAYYEDYGDDLVHLGTSMEGVKIGLVVPTYMDIDSIEDLNN